MAKTCPKGQILRVGYKRGGYYRKPYTRKDGTKVKGAWIGKSEVGEACVPDTGLPHKTPASRKVLPKLKKGELGKYGYKDVKNLSTKKRREALEEAVRDAGYATIIRRLNAVANYTVNSDPKAHSIYRSDMKWIQDNLCLEYSLRPGRCAKKASKKSSKESPKKASKKSSI